MCGVRKGAPPYTFIAEHLFHYTMFCVLYLLNSSGRALVYRRETKTGPKITLNRLKISSAFLRNRIALPLLNDELPNQWTTTNVLLSCHNIDVQMVHRRSTSYAVESGMGTLREECILSVNVNEVFIWQLNIMGKAQIEIFPQNFR